MSVAVAPDRCAASIEARIRRVVGQVLAVDPSRFDERADLVDDLGADSLDALELQRELEIEFSIQTDPSAFDGLRQVGALGPLVRAAMAAQASDGAPVPLPLEGVDVEAFARLIGASSLVLIARGPNGCACAGSFAVGAGAAVYGAELAQTLWSATSAAFRTFPDNPRTPPEA